MSNLLFQLAVKSKQTRPSWSKQTFLSLFGLLSTQPPLGSNLSSGATKGSLVELIFGLRSIAGKWFLPHLR